MREANEQGSEVQGLRVLAEGSLEGEDALRRFMPFVGAHEAGRLVRVIDPSWSRSRAEELDQFVGSERLEELSNGFALNDQEKVEWDDARFTDQIYAEMHWLSRIDDGSGPIWFSTVTDGMTQGSTEIDAAGPFFRLETLIQHCAEASRGWYGWCLLDDGGSKEAEAIRVALRTSLECPERALF